VGAADNADGDFASACGDLPDLGLNESFTCSAAGVWE